MQSIGGSPSTPLFVTNVPVPANVANPVIPSIGGSSNNPLYVTNLTGAAKISAYARAQFHGLRSCGMASPLLSIGTFNPGEDSQVTSQMGIIINSPVSRLSFVHIGWEYAATTNFPNINYPLSYDQQASLVVIPNSSTPIDLTWDNQKSISLDQGSTVVSDPIGVNLAPTTTTTAITALSSTTVTLESIQWFYVGQICIIGGYFNNALNNYFGGSYEAVKITAINTTTNTVTFVNLVDNSTALYSHAVGATFCPVVFVRTFQQLPQIVKGGDYRINANVPQNYSGTSPTGGTNATPATIVISSATPSELANAASGANMMTIVSGTGAGQYALIASIATTLGVTTATMTTAWKNGSAAPDTTSFYSICPATVRLPYVISQSAFSGYDQSNAIYNGGLGSNIVDSVTFTGTNAGVWGPVAVLGDSPNAAIGAYGDSITADTGTSAGNTGSGRSLIACGWFDTAFFNKQGILNLSQSSTGIDNFVAGSWTRSMGLTPIVDNMILAEGTNDVSTTTVANFFINLSLGQAAIGNFTGIPVYAVTIPPRTNSSDNYITVTNQIPSSALEMWRSQMINYTLRNNLPSNFAGMIDRAEFVECTNLSNTPGVTSAATAITTPIIGGTTTTFTVANPTGILSGLVMVIGDDVNSKFETINIQSVNGNTITLTGAPTNSYAAGVMIFSGATWTIGTPIKTLANPTATGTTTTIIDTTLPSDSSNYFYGLPISITQGGVTVNTYVTTYQASTSKITFNTAVAANTTTATVYSLSQPSCSLGTSNAGLHPSDYGHYLMSKANLPTNLGFNFATV